MKEISTMGVVGAGQMGRGIAQVAIQAGFSVLVYDEKKEALDHAEGFIVEKLSAGIKKGKWTQENADLAIKRLKKANSFEDFSHCDLVIEAATEKKEIKFSIFRKLDQVLDVKAILASNTSSISITEIAACTQRPSQVAGMHFMNPVPVMKLIEGIRGSETSDETFQLISNVAKKMNKIFISVEDGPGFAVNRILMPMVNEAAFTLYEGIANAKDIDTAMKLGANWPMGPLELADFIGLDTCLSIMEILYEGFGDSKYRPCPLLKKYVAAGRWGRKTRYGFYKY
ncbi:MAG: 3-hydroxyacyl-CoA dehydrogenase NAD-binding domain-containing protein [Halobacteriovoraceae bacterium]|nr:3-hydroxyacyl-CoA dehydrogenase NAD-binding domain-containing protein [Halobacteriovoraceae bacterium]